MPKFLPVLVLGVGFLAVPWGLAGPEKDAPRLRRPIALALVDGGKRLLVANRDSGTIAELDAETLKVVAETRVGRKPSDLTLAPAADLVLATDEEAGELVVLSYHRNKLGDVRHIKTGHTPVSVRVSDDGRLATVACLWPRRLMIHDLQDDSATTAIDLPFAPRRQLGLPGTGKLLVADGFAGKLALVDVSAKKLESVRGLPAHNLRGLALSTKSVLLTHQVIHAQGHPREGDIRSGSLLANEVHRLALSDVLDPAADLLRHDRVYPVGDIELGAGDPTEVAEGPDGSLLVTVAGTDELLVGRPEQALWTRLAVGRRPTALAVDAARRRAYVANTFGDSVSVVDLQGPRVIAEVPLGKPADLTPAERGEVLFHDARLSFEGWFSCHSCHPDGHTSGRLNDNLTDGSFGTPKRILSLLGTKDTGPWAWNGKMPDLEAQVQQSIRSTMQGPAPTPQQVADLIAYLRTLPPAPAVAQARGTVAADAVKRGQRVFGRQKCATCHTPPAYTSAKTYDVGLRDEAGGTQFNPPSLRGVSQGGPYFHDGRAATLDDVFTRHRHQLADPLPDQELADLLTFLRSL